MASSEREKQVKKVGAYRKANFSWVSPEDSAIISRFTEGARRLDPKQPAMWQRNDASGPMAARHASATPL